ncbi:vomeronasal type-2 receptor 26-like [Engystomops pustulosus]|uniref:vomeronasal type-2 receptor 26-like n=1 Tax=Engystomops pustulosus TaxID=76066 RepID=UPI003AFAC130
MLFPCRPLLSNYKYFLDFQYAIEEVNTNPHLLPNVTLGYYVSDSCASAKKSVKSVIQILSGARVTIPNYNCMEDNIAGLIGDGLSATTLPIAQILNVYGYTQISYGATDPMLSNRALYPYLFRTAHNDHVYFSALLRLLKYFSWSWVGIVTSADDSGNKESETLFSLLNSQGICVEFTVPRSQCSENCLPGSRKIKITGRPICCYACVICSEGEISNITDSENCIKCLPTEWSSNKRDQCFPKSEEFLSYFDSLSMALSAVAILLWTISVLILGIFISHKDTPIVKANNKDLSFILLVSLSLCFLCVFLFIGRPVDRTCKLRQIIFSIIFSISVSSVLAKTIIVYVAFKTPRPGSPWKRLIGKKVPNSIVVVASSVEVIISVVWLYFSPPYLEQDTHSYQRKIVIQCNEGSQVGFFAVLGYLFLLAAVSFCVAYLARTLPDRFNEAKYITFSMLVFCSVWITMVPSYLSTKGKDMVAVEIFSILASSAGLLGFIFFPKCYIIFLKPEFNKKKQLTRR